MIDLIPIDPTESWPPEKKKNHGHLLLLTERILEKKVDVTSKMGSDWVTITLSYAMFGDKEKNNYHKVCQISDNYSFDACEDKFKWAVEKGSMKTLRRMMEICRFHGIDTAYTDEASPGEEKKSQYLPPDVNEEFFDTYGFFEKKNQYFTLERAGDKGKWNAVAFTNFSMKVLFHMNNGMQPRRVIELTNNRGRKKIVDIATDRLSGKNDFKKFCEGLGNFRFFGSESRLDLIKSYLYETENECQEINVLGWHEDGFWAWSNGVFNAKFHGVDGNGFVELHDKHYYLPSGNTQQPNRYRRFSNELRFKHYTDAAPSFQQWSKMYFDVFGINGAVILTFSVACLFSDIIFQVKNFFPLLFIYGEGGSGKGSAVKFAQRIFGIPQDPLTLSGKSNTDKAKIAVFAQFVNSMLLLEEYVPNHDIDQLLKNLWDRYGYKRRTMDMGYGTETVPIQSGVAITGNFSPTDDPLLQRLIYLEHNENQFSVDQRLKFNQLKEFSDMGITSVTHEILSKRPDIQARYQSTHPIIFKEIYRDFTGVHVTDRMIENITIVITIFELLSSSGIQFPFEISYLIKYLIDSTINQNKKRDSGGEVQKFFDVFNYAVQTGLVLEDVHYRLDGDQLFFNIKTLYGTYAEMHRKQYGISAPSESNLRDKLKIHHAFEHYLDSVRIGGNKTSSYVFRHSKIGIDLVLAGDTYKMQRNAKNSLSVTFEEKMKQNREKIEDPF